MLTLAQNAIHVTDSYSDTTSSPLNIFSPFFFLFFFFSFCLFRAAPAAYGGSQTRGPIRAVAAGLRYSHSSAESEPRLQPTPQLMAMPDP